MKVYLVQHAEAMSKEQDADRSLTEKGRQDIQAVAELAARLGIRVYQIRHSGKTRARQTAEILGAALSPAGGIVAASGLGPEDDVEPVANELAAVQQPVMLVGHLPFMEHLSAQMLVGHPDRAVVRFTKAGIVNLTREDGDWQVTWIVTPEIARL